MSNLNEFAVRLIKTDDCGITTIGFYLDRSERFEVVSCRIGDHKVMMQPNDHGKFRFRLPFGRHTATLIARGPNDYLTIIKSFEVLDPQTELIRRIVREELAAVKAEETDRRQQMLADVRARRPVDAFVKYEDDPDHQGNEDIDTQRIKDALTSVAGLLRAFSKDEITEVACTELDYVRSVIDGLEDRS